MMTQRPETEEMLRVTARRDGRDADELVDALLTYALEQEGLALAEERQAVQEGLDAALSGRELPWNEFLAEQRAKYSILRENSPR